MMKKMLLIALAVALSGLLLGSRNAEAAVASSSHDMITAGFTGSWGGQGVCSYCHVPHAAKGARLWAADTDATVPVYDANTIAGLCYSCHDGTVNSNAAHQSSVYNAAEVNHPLLNTASIPATDITAPTWPYATATTSNIECTSCHNIHDNANSQFLRDVWFAVGADAQDATSDNSMFCNNCHNSRAMEASRNTVGGHPVGPAVVDSRRYTVAGTVDMVRAPFNGAALYPAASATLGGHLSAYTTGGVVCMTCHQPHGAADGFILVDDNTVGVGYNGLCENCHSVNPSLRFATDRAAHPVDAGTGDGVSAATGETITILNYTDFSLNLQGAKQATGTQEILCLSCHDVHQANPSTAITRVELGVVNGGICDDCHGTSPFGGSTHPINVTLAQDDGGTWPNNDGLPLYGTGSDEVTCDTCHGAHDGDAAPAVSLLRIRSNNSELCNGCHTAIDNTTNTWAETGRTYPAIAAAGADGGANPSGYIMPQGFTADLGALNSQTGTHAANRTIDKTEWAVSLTSDFSVQNSYGTAGTTIICESCHAVHGADAVGGWSPDKSAIGNNLLFRQNGKGATRTNPNSGAYNEADDSYCSACHADRTTPATNPVAPSGTHPVQSWNVTRTAAAVNTTATSFADVNPPVATADYDGGTDGVMTCESCHAPHAAGTGMGSFCLEAGTGAATAGARPGAARNRDTLCALCHSY
jgi:predicted CXXCH cytochrome family protein